MSMGWHTAQLSELQAEKRWAMNGGPFGSKLGRRDYTDSGVPVIRGANLSSDGRFSFDGLAFVSEEKADELLANNAHPGDLVFTQRGTLGQVGLIPFGCGYDRFVISQSQMKLSVNEAIANPHFLYYFFRAPDTVQTIQNLGMSSGVPHINLDILRKFEIRLPSLDIQCGIADILSAYDDLIENNTRRIAILEEMARAIYREWFVEFRFPGHEEVEMVDSDLGPVPEGWEVVPLSAMSTMSRESLKPQEHPEETFAHFSIPAYDSGRMPARELGESIRSNKYIVPSQAILISKLNPRISRVWLPSVAADRRAVCSTEFVVLEPKGVSREFLYSMLSSDELAKRIAGRAGGTSTSHQRIRPDDLLSLQVVAPGRAAETEYARTAPPTLQLAENLRNRNAVLRETRDLLLPKLISGEIDVSEAEEELEAAAV